RAPSKAHEGFCERPAGRFRKPISPLPPLNLGRMSWTPDDFRPASIPFLLCGRYDQLFWRY
ncbi:MAG: hypothetical protein WA656_06755, partial [Pseudolabrys sp.]